MGGKVRDAARKRWARGERAKAGIFAAGFFRGISAPRLAPREDGTVHQATDP
jgi:hypothetical protein